MIQIGPISIPKRTAAGGMIISAIIALTALESISGDLALMSILGVGSALGAYESARTVHEESDGIGGDDQ